MGKAKKTNVIRILDQKNINYNTFQYDKDDGKIDGISVAYKIGKDPKVVYKTLVAQGSSKNIYVFIIPVSEELDLKKGAKVAGEKKIDLIPVKEILKVTGYIRGGCSPIGMKKKYKTFIDTSAFKIEKIVVSGGKIGIQIEIDVSDLIKVTEAKLENVIK
ncbi:Cys-tRNA(Pro) deacylase [Paramaledivibacter caminithermalis]|jgi:Cys-tRNA(Pro)/Cys-tRNA(Cys) deacylase|uniref:Cys-tRNA(Pro)/Cys-tRNA(Cys) deacylase n=1 Tax=Paramaledivibacter caminithermalis (strain DSM 15212 / CIP 107654 / DViRD3) TaxID=1121301 RepID=A0A1M6MS26_PARC5|nr:Cys-tRNA(Pro) deacylase [Paramaledivibacter caminithermalis]SHJ86083.1 Cys-tRNA(Pro)/Cys-tRNA(Cys) deacylase [Paramaledivibacter caminithermalis DSM 15212]